MAVMYSKGTEQEYIKPTKCFVNNGTKCTVVGTNHVNSHCK